MKELSRIAFFNTLFKEYDEVYHNYASKHGLSDTSFWILYSICSASDYYSPKKLSDDLHIPSQTLNSALKSLENRGLIELRFKEGSNKNKLIILTTAGEKIANEVVRPLIEKENESFLYFNEKEFSFLMDSLDKYIKTLKKKIDVG